MAESSATPAVQILQAVERLCELGNDTYIPSSLIVVVLANLLTSHLQIELPRVIKSIDASIKECENRLGTLGPARNTRPEQERFLREIGTKLSEKLTWQDTHQRDSMLSSCEFQFKINELREVFQKSLETEIVEMDQSTMHSDHTIYSHHAWKKECHLKRMPPKGVSAVFDLGKEVSMVAKSSTVTVVDIKTSKWLQAACEYLDGVAKCLEKFLGDILLSCLDVKRADWIWRHHFEADISARQRHALALVQLFLTPLQSIHDPTAPGNRFLTVEILPENSTAYQKAKKYADVMVNWFSMNVTTLAVEGCMFKEIDETFSGNSLATIPDDKLALLAGEFPEDMKEREEIETKLKALKIGREQCQTLLSKMPGAEVASEALSSTSNHDIESYSANSNQCQPACRQPLVEADNTIGMVNNTPETKIDSPTNLQRAVQFAQFNFAFPPAQAQNPVRTNNPLTPPKTPNLKSAVSDKGGFQSETPFSRLQKPPAIDLGISTPISSATNTPFKLAAAPTFNLFETPTPISGATTPISTTPYKAEAIPHPTLVADKTTRYRSVGASPLALGPLLCPSMAASASSSWNRYPEFKIEDLDDLKGL